MALISFTPQLQRFTATPELECGAATLREALEAAFAANPRLRGYVLDDQGHLRANVVCLIDGRRCTERILLTDALQPASRIYVLQARLGRHAKGPVRVAPAWRRLGHRACELSGRAGQHVPAAGRGQLADAGLAHHRSLRHQGPRQRGRRAQLGRGGCAGAPDVLWCQHHGGIWRSTDNAASWHEITAAPMSSFGFGVAVHPRDPDTAWFAPAEADQRRVPVGAAMIVNRTRDGGKTFETLREGQPQSHAYDLVYRHGLAVADDGESLLMTSTSGGLWASVDGADHWQTVSQSLPPAAAVRFG